MAVHCGDCGKFVAGDEYRHDRGDCRDCWLRYHKPYFTAKYGPITQAKDWPPPGWQPPANSVSTAGLQRFRRQGTCPHRGAQIGQTPCTCTGGKLLDLYACDKHGRCTLLLNAADRSVRCCEQCPDHPDAAAHAERLRQARERRRTERQKPQ
jgi:hypothetical protein